MSDFPARFVRVYERSRLRSVVASLAHRSQWATTVARHAVITTVLVVIWHRLAVITAASKLATILTKPPDNEVIVIDLRDTYTVGPVLSLLTAVSSVIAPHYRRVRANLSTDRVRDSLRVFGVALGVLSTATLTVAAFVTALSSDAIMSMLALVGFAIACVLLSTRRAAVTDSRTYTVAYVLFQPPVDTES